MQRTHRYHAEVAWTGNRGEGTASYRAYDRASEVRGDGKPPIPGSSDPAFRGDAERWNPEELLVVALSQCHMLWYLHLAAVSGVVVAAYTDSAEGTMLEGDDGGGRFTEVILRPVVTVASADMADKADSLHHRANELCFIANSVNFPVRHEPTTSVA
ncbi:MAG TPA: OsmC family protein [Actinomycetes bacterium]|jgi:organic hydroperoxide reductase OsmC/OhrA|nr:OsmC family protein [Actinomycetes bacterium]